MKKSKLSFFFLIALFSLSFPALHAEPEITVETKHYQVEGNTVEELSEAMKLNVPPQLGEHFASTKWNVIWSYESVPGPHGCSVTSSNVKLEVIFYLPEWRRSPDEDTKTRKKWEKFMKKLQLHEDGHQKIGLEAGRMIEKILNRIGNLENCGEVDRAVNHAGQAVMAEKRAEEVRYDIRTRHGLRQGARLKYSKPKA